MKYQKEGVNISAYINEGNTLKQIPQDISSENEEPLIEKSEMLGFFRR